MSFDIGKPVTIVFLNDRWPWVTGDLVGMTEAGVEVAHWMFLSGEFAGVVNMTRRLFPWAAIYCVEQS